MLLNCPSMVDNPERVSINRPGTNAAYDEPAGK